MLKGKKILLGITASIAAYKINSLVRLLIKAGAEVKVILSPAAKEFVSALTLATLSKNGVESEFVKNKKGEWTNHVELGLWADVFLIAPASANTLAKMAHGICDNLLMATYLSARCPVMVAPAMDLDMHAHPATQNNLTTLKKFGVRVIDSAKGELASGLHGKGRMAEPAVLLKRIEKLVSQDQSLKGKKILINAGPTYEAIDPVRFIGNRSSGLMGYSLAEVCAQRGAEVILVSGPTNLDINNKNVKVINVESADDMFKTCTKEFKNCDAAILAAAVADYKPLNPSKEKIKKKETSLHLELTKTKDILSTLGSSKNKNQILVGFALETNNEIENARLKLKNKNLDFIVLNSLKDKGAGFKNSTNKIRIINKENKIKNFTLKDKSEVATDIIDYLETYFA